jgi:hypothetical protein
MRRIINALSAVLVCQAIIVGLLSCYTPPARAEGDACDNSCVRSSDCEDVDDCGCNNGAGSCE